jgi:hypothetical protein
MTRTVDDASLGECLKISMELPGREPAEDDVVRRCVVLHDQAHIFDACGEFLALFDESCLAAGESCDRDRYENERSGAHNDASGDQRAHSA